MIKVSGLKKNFTPIKVISEKDNIYIISWDYQDITGDIGIWVEDIFYYKPTKNELRNIINDYYNTCITNKITNGFIWKDIPVWLSLENQQNYKSVYDLAVQTNGTNLPVEFKFGGDTTPIYYHFYTIEELQSFYLSMQKYIQSCLQEGWRLKDAVDYTLYKIE